MGAPGRSSRGPERPCPPLAPSARNPTRLLCPRSDWTQPRDLGAHWPSRVLLRSCPRPLVSKLGGAARRPGQGRPESDPRTPARPPFGDVPDGPPERRGQVWCSFVLSGPPC